MRIEELKTGFWGYKKFSVYQYIADLEKTFSAKLLEKDQESHELLEKERARVHQLEEELHALQEKYDAQEKEQTLIAATLLEAQRHAELLKEQSEERERAARQRLKETLAQKDRELEQYDERIRQIRELVQSTLREMDDSTRRLAEEIGAVRAGAPCEDCSPICDKPEVAE